MIKNIFALVLSAGVTAAQAATPLVDYSAVQDALLAGQTVKIITNFAQCTPGAKTAKNLAKMMMYGIFTPNEIGITDNYIATAMTHFTLNDPFYPNKPVFEFVRYTVKPDNTMQVSLNILDAANYKLLDGSMSFNCPLNDGVKFFVE